MRRSRRWISSLVVVGIVWLLVAGIAWQGHVAASPQQSPGLEQHDASSFVVEQGDRCIGVEPFATDRTVEELYEYRSHDTHPDLDPADRTYSSYGTTDLQEADASLLFLHEGPDGVSLVVVHDELGSETDGGAATFDVVGLPVDGEWVVDDDDLDHGYDTITHGGTWSEMTWNWREGRTDGGAFNGGLDEFEITVHPAFNDEAEYRNHEGEIDEWQVLSGDADDPDRHELALDERVVVRTGTCDDPTVAYDRTDDGIVAEIEDAGPDDRVLLRPPAGPDANATYHRMSLTPSAEGDLEVTLSATVDAPGIDSASELEGVTALSYLSVDASSESAGMDSGSVSFSVTKERLEETGIETDDVALYAHEDDTWVALPTEPVDETEETYRFEAEIEAPTTFAVATQRPSVALADVTLDETTIVEGEDVEITATIENRGAAAGSFTVDLEAFGDRVDSRDLTVEAGETETVTFSQQIASPGTYTLRVNDTNHTVTVEPETTTTSSASDEETRLTTSTGTVIATTIVALALLAIWRRM